MLAGEGLHPVDVLLHDVRQHYGRGRVNPVDQAVEYSFKPVQDAVLNFRSGWLKGASRLPRALKDGRESVCRSYVAVQTIWISTGLFSVLASDLASQR